MVAVDSLRISEAAARSRAEAAEAVLADAQRGRAELAERLRGVEGPAAEQREALLAAEDALTEARLEIERLKAEKSGGPGGDNSPLVKEIRFELAQARAEAAKASKDCDTATAHAADLLRHQKMAEEESAQLRLSLSEQMRTSDEHVELGKLQWELLGARRAEGDAKRREAAAKAKAAHVQTRLYKAQLLADARDAEIHDLGAAAHKAQAEHAREHAELQMALSGCAPLATLELKTAQACTAPPAAQHQRQAETTTARQRSHARPPTRGR